MLFFSFDYQGLKNRPKCFIMANDCETALHHTPGGKHVGQLKIRSTRYGSLQKWQPPASLTPRWRAG